jgi:hypothetical protein
MENPTTWRYCRLSSPDLDRTELIVGKVVNRIRAVLFQSIRSSGTRRQSPFARWRETRTALSRFAPSPKIISVRLIAGDLGPIPRSVVGFQTEIRI